MTVPVSSRFTSWLTGNVIRRYSPMEPFASSLAREGITTFPILQLASTSSAANIFRAAVESARASHHQLGACLHLYGAWEYQQMQTFVSPDALAGFALKGQEVVSVFSHKMRRNGRASKTLMVLATALGGVFLNAYDTVLPELYAGCGFRAVARLSWDDRRAPKDWDYGATAQFNGGRPDIVFMAFGAKGTEERIVSSYDEGVRVQHTAVRSCFEEVRE